jgi:hypothetical protein
MRPTIKRRVPLIFRRALRRAIWRAWKDGKISGADAYLLYDVVQGSQRGGRFYKKPELLTESEKECRKRLEIHDPESALTGDIDWSHWIDLLVEWLPVIIKIVLTLLAFAEPPANEPSESSKITPPYAGA